MRSVVFHFLVISETKTKRHIRRLVSIISKHKKVYYKQYEGRNKFNNKPSEFLPQHLITGIDGKMSSRKRLIFQRMLS